MPAPKQASRDRIILALALAGLAAASAPAAPAAAPADSGAAAATPAPATGSDPVALLKKKDQELQQLLRSGEAGKKTERIKHLINDIFDFQELGRRALGPETWKSMSPAQQKRFVAAFQTMVENASVKKLEVYQADSTAYETPKIQGNNASVTVHAYSKGQESVLQYKLTKGKSGWRAWDLVIDDLSTARNYGEQFKKILQTTNIDGLIAKVEAKAKGGAEGAAGADNQKSKSEQGRAAAKPKAAPAQ